jgi:Uncharacterised protein family (UPF0236)
VILNGSAQTSGVDLEALEMATRRAMHEAGARVLTLLLQEDPPVDRSLACACGGAAEYVELRPKTILTAVGWVQMLRSYFLCPGCHRGFAPLDRELGVAQTDFSPGVKRMMSLAGSQGPFAHGREELESLAGLVVTTKAVERVAEGIGDEVAKWQEQQISQVRKPEGSVVDDGTDEIPILYIQIDGTGIPVVAADIDPTKPGKQGEQQRTREVKLGCVFTQTKSDDQGRPVRDECATTYVAAIENAEEFGWRIYAEARRRGLDRAKLVVVIADGAVWIWNLVQTHFPGAIEILDLYHAREHLWKLAAKLFPADDLARRRWVKRFQKKLDGGMIKRLVTSLRSIQPDDLLLRQTIQTEADYFQKNSHRMQYPKFRRQNLFVGSGVVEAGCKTIIGSRFKLSGMFWTVRGANAIIALRCSMLNGSFEDFWATRAA